MNNLLNYFGIAYSNIRRKKLRSWLTLIGIIIGIATVVSLNALGEGLEFAIESQFGNIGSDIITVMASGGFGPPGSGVIDPLTDDEYKALESVAGVETVAGRIIQFGKVTYNKKATFVFAISLSENKESRYILEKIFNMKADFGRMLEPSDSKKVFLGHNFYDDKVGLGKPILPGDKILVNDEEFEVVGILDKKGNFQFDSGVFMNEKVLIDTFDKEKDVYDILIVEFDKNDDVAAIKSRIEKKLRKVRDVDIGEEDFSVETPESLLENVNSVLLSVRIFVIIIASISVLVGGVGIMNTMYTAVLERIREIGIMKSIGATNKAVFILFFIESGLIGVVGGTLGAIFGSGLALLLAGIGRMALGSNLIAVHITPQLIGYAIFGSFFIGSFFGTLPAFQASKMKPVDALRYIK